MVDVQIQVPAGGGGPVGRALGKGCGTLFFGVFLSLGVFFMWAVAREALRAHATHSWTPHSCTIDVSERYDTGNDGSPYGLRVGYHYQEGGQTHTGNRYSTREASFSDYTALQRLLDRYPVGATVPCLVDPGDATQAVLEPGSRAIGFLIFLPLIFVLVGGGGIAGTWWASGKAAERKSSRIQATVGRAHTSPAWLPAFFAVFLLAGLGVAVALAPAFRRAFSARNWTPRECVVESSAVRFHEATDSDSSDTYSIDILYRYEVGGRTRRASRYEFFAGSSSGQASKQQVVDEYPPGRQFTCYVNPDDLAEAVIQRELGWSLLLGLIPLVLVGIGGGGIAWALRTRRAEVEKARELAAREFSARPPAGAPVAAARVSASLGARARAEASDFLPDLPEESGPVVLKPEATPLGRLIGGIFVMLFWNGIVSVFVFQAVKAFRSGSPEWGLMVFLIPFVLFGLAIVGFVIMSLLQLANPRPTVKLRCAVVALGGTLEVAWELSGRTHVIERFHVWLEGTEEVTYRRGTDDHTERNTFRRIEILKTDDRREFAQGQERVEVPADTIHSFDAPSNKVVWNLCVRGEIRRWPDVDEKYRVVIVPPELDGAEGKRS